MKSTRKQVTSRLEQLWSEFWRTMGMNVKLKEKQEWSNEKHHLEKARKLRGIHFNDSENKEFKEIIKNAWKKLETSVAPSLLLKLGRKTVGLVNPTTIKQDLRVFLKLMSLQDSNWRIFTESP